MDNISNVQPANPSVGGIKPKLKPELRPFQLNLEPNVGGYASYKMVERATGDKICTIKRIQAPKNQADYFLVTMGFMAGKHNRQRGKLAERIWASYKKAADATRG